MSARPGLSALYWNVSQCPGYKLFFHRPPKLVRDNSSSIMEEVEIEGESDQRKQEGLGNW